MTKQRYSHSTIYVDQVTTRLDSDRWLRAHPELGQLVQQFTATALKHKPDDIEQFAVDYFVHGKYRSNEQSTNQLNDEETQKSDNAETDNPTY